MGKDCYDIDIALDNMLGSEFVDKVRDYLLSTGEQVQGVAVIPWYAFFFFANLDTNILGSDMYFAIAHNFISMSFCFFFKILCYQMIVAFMPITLIFQQS